MRRFFVFILGLLPLVLWAALPLYPKLHAALNAHLLANKQGYFGAAKFQPIEPTEYRVELLDLNGDGVREAMVLMLGRHWGGSGGQSMFLFRGTRDGFSWLGRMTCVQFPMEGSVCVMKTKTKGWCDLAVRVHGRGAKQKYAAMKFDGARYPLNPTVQAVMADWPEGKFVLVSGDGSAKALAAGRTHFTGLLGKATRLQMGLEHQRGRVSGTYYYEKYGTLISLEGEASANRLVLKEMSDKKVTATLTLTKQATGWAGEWRSADGRKKYPLRFQQVAAVQARTELGPHESSCVTAYPQFTGAVGQRFNAAIAKGFLERYRKSCEEFDETFLELAAEVKKNPDALGASYKRWTFEDSATVRYFSPDLISVRGHNYEYTGGAHGNYYDFPVNYWLKNGRAAQVNLVDLFEPKKNWQSTVGGFIRRDLKKRGASWPPKTDKEATEAAFTFSPAGVEFHFAPYAVGSYAEGSYHVLVPFTVLRPVLRADGPLARWAK